MKIDGNKLLAEDGKALRRKGEQEPSTIVRVSLSQSDSPDNWEDCEYGNTSEVTEADKDAALRGFGVEV